MARKHRFKREVNETWSFIRKAEAQRIHNKRFNDKSTSTDPIGSYLDDCIPYQLFLKYGPTFKIKSATIENLLKEEKSST